MGSDRPWVVDLLDPRAPPEEVWSKMSPAERDHVCAALPSEVERATPPEGDRHRLPKTRAIEALGEFFRRTGRRVYLSSELPIYYPNERMFAPDVIAVVDVEPHERDRWVVTQGERGIDLAIEVTLRGSARKDLEENVARYARLGINEYFVLDARALRLIGYRLDGARYLPIIPQGGRWASSVLGLDLALESGRVRFFHGSAPLLEASELITRLEAMTDDLVSRKEDAERGRDDAERGRDDAERGRDDAERGRDDAERGRDDAERGRNDAERGKAEAEKRADRLARKLRELGIDPDLVD